MDVSIFELNGFRILITYYIFFLAYRLPQNPDSLVWWIDARFQPHSDNTLVISVGAYYDRGSTLTLVPISQLVKGLIYTITFEDNGDKSMFIH